MNAHISNAGKTQESKAVITDKYIEETLALLDAEIEAMRTYHNHKETMAYSATVAFAAVLLLASTAAPVLATPGARAAFASVIVLLRMCTGCFVHMQFTAKWKATNREVSYHRVKLRLIARQELAALDTSLPKVTQGDVDASVWPKFIADEIGREMDRSPRSLRRVRSDPRYHSELPAYGFIILVTGLSLSALWFVQQSPPAGSAGPVLSAQQRATAGALAGLGGITFRAGAERG